MRAVADWDARIARGVKEAIVTTARRSTASQTGRAVRSRWALFMVAVVLGILPTFARAGMNLLTNPSNEMALVGGEIPGWTKVVGSYWTQRSEDPSPFDGEYYFFAGGDEFGELAQVVDISALATAVDAGLQVFDFQGYVRAWIQDPPDASRIVVEYRAANDTVLGSFDSGNISSLDAWCLVSDGRIAPVGARNINVRLISTRNNGWNNDGYYDALSLQTHVVPVPGAALLGALGLSFAGWRLRRRVA